MSKFARIIEVDENTQVLLTISARRDDKFDLIFHTVLKKMRLVLTLTFETREKSLEVMESITLDEAEIFLTKVRNKPSLFEDED